MASVSSSWLTGRIPNLIGSAVPVRTATTPGSACARLVSMALIRACAWVLRNSRPCSIRGKLRSSANFVCPVHLPIPSTRGSGFPMTEKPPCILAPPARRHVAVSRPGGRQFHGLEDLHISRAAAEIARQRLRDLLPRGIGLRVEQRLGRQEDPRRADRKSTR